MVHYSITLVSDTVCPWCYIGKRRLERAMSLWTKTHPADTFSTRFQAFQLNPDAPTTGIDKANYYATRFGPERTAMIFQRLDSVGKPLGITFAFGGKTGNTRDSHRVIELAGRKGGEVQSKVVEALNAAYFEKEGDITSWDVLVQAGVDGGLEGKEVREWLESGKGGKEVDEQVRGARSQFISGVPYFTVNGRWHVEGAQEPQAFLEVFEEIGGLKGEGKE
jgi:predicted DsbA family dithiol-disulfide isomerase